MTYSTFLHSSLINPAKPKIKENEIDQPDKITMDVPLLTRILELAREDIKSDQDLHNILTNIINMKNKDVLTMTDYDAIIKKETKNDDQVELESILKLAGISQ